MNSSERRRRGPGSPRSRSTSARVVPYIPLEDGVQRGVLAARDDVQAVALIRAEIMVDLGHALGVARTLRSGGTVPASFDEAAELLASNHPKRVEQIRKQLRAGRVDVATKLLRRKLDAEPAVAERLAEALQRTAHSESG